MQSGHRHGRDSAGGVTGGVAARGCEGARGVVSGLAGLRGGTTAWGCEGVGGVVRGRAGLRGGTVGQGRGGVWHGGGRGSEGAQRCGRWHDNEGQGMGTTDGPSDSRGGGGASDGRGGGGDERQSRRR